MSKSHLWVSIYNFCLSGSGLPHEIWCFLYPSISSQISRCSYFFCCIVLHCVNVPHLPYPFFCQGLLGCFQVLSMTNNAPMNMVEHMSFWYNWTSFGYIPKSGIAGYLGRLFPNFLRNLHSGIQRDCTSLHLHQQCRGVHFTVHSLQHKLWLLFFFILAIITGVR